MAQTNLPSYPAPPGNKPIVIANVTGPASYTQVTNGTPPTGGQAINPKDYGLAGGIEYADGGFSDNGQYNIQPIIPSNPLYGVQSIILRWVVAATGAEVSGATNLSGRTARILFWGA